MDSLTCTKCNMSFRSVHFMVKHKETFCIGAVSQSESQKIREKIRKHQQHQDFPETQQVKGVQTSQHKPEPSIKPTGHSDRSEDHHTRELDEVYECNALLSDGCKQLDMQRQEFDYKLLAAENGKVAELERMLLELKEHEQRNTDLLETLMDHLQQNGQDIHPNHDSIGYGHVANTEEKVIERFIPVYGCGVLSTEISTLRISYLQSGGKDPQILAHLQGLLDAAIQLEMRAAKRPKAKRQRDNRKYLSRELVSTEVENQRLEEEIMKLELKKRTSRTTPKFSSAEQEMRAAKMNVDLLKHEIEVNRLRKQIMSRKMVPSIVTFPPLEGPRSAILTKHLLKESDGLFPGPYDPMTGFVVFYDFLLGLCPSYRVCRLMVGIYNGDICLGSPSILPPVYCDPVSFPHHSVEHRAILASKQAVPGVQPASSISLVMQVQASGGYDIYGHELTHLAPRGWLKLHIFDHHNRVISGRWKVPIRLLPAKPSMTTAEINAVPQLGNAELYLRIVNIREADIQSSVPISIHNAVTYQYPPVQSPEHFWGMQEPHEAIQFPAVQSAQAQSSAFSQRLLNTAAKAEVT